METQLLSVSTSFLHYIWYLLFVIWETVFAFDYETHWIHIQNLDTPIYHNSSEHKKALIEALTYANWSFLFSDMFDIRLSHSSPSG